MLAALLLNPHPSSSPVRPRRRRWRHVRTWDCDNAKELYEEAVKTIPVADQNGLLASDYEALPPPSKVDFDQLCHDMDTLMALISAIDKAEDRRRMKVKQDEEAFIVSLLIH